MRNEIRHESSRKLVIALNSFFFCALLFLFFQNYGFAFLLPGIKKAPQIFGHRMPFLLFQTAIALFPLLLLIMRRDIAAAFVKNNKAYAVFLGYLCVSVIWSPTPLISFYHAAALLVFVSYFWIYFYFHPEPGKALAPILHFLNTLVCVSLLFAVLSPATAFHQFGENQGAFKGIFNHKNILAHTALFAAVINLDGLKNRGKRIYFLLMSFASLTALMLAKSMATTLAAVIGLAFFLWLLLRGRRKKRQGNAPAFLLLVLPGILSISSNFQCQGSLPGGSARAYEKKDISGTVLSHEYQRALKAYEVLDRSLAEEPNFTGRCPDAYVAISRGHIKKGEYRRAFLWLKKGLSQYRNHIGLNRALFEFHSGMRRKDYATRLNNLKKADFCLDRLMHIDSGNKRQYLQDRIELYLYFKKFSKAEKTALDAVRTYPSELVFINYLGRIHIESGNTRKFNSLLKQASGGNGAAGSYLRFLKESKNTRYKAAIKHLDKWIAWKNQNGNIRYDDYFMKFRYLFDTKQFKEALSLAVFLEKEYAREKAHIFEIRNWKGYLYERIGYFNKAETVYRNLSRDHPWLEGYYTDKMSGHAWGTIGPWLTRLFLSSPVETNLYGLCGRDFTLSDRSKIWHEMFRSIQDNLLFGKGYAGFWDRSVDKSPILSKVHGAHNGYLDIVNELGTAGFLLFLFFWIPLFTRCIRLYRSGRSQGLMLLALLVTITLLNFSYPLLFRLNQGFLMMNFVIFASLSAGRKRADSE